MYLGLTKAPKMLSSTFQGYTRSYELSVTNSKSAIEQLVGTRQQISRLLRLDLGEMKGLKFSETLKVTFEKELWRDSGFTYKTAYFNSKTKMVINLDGLINVTSSKDEVLNSIGVWISEGSGWVIDKIDNHYVNVVKYVPLKGSSYIELPPELRNPRKGLINIRNNDDECFRWCHLAKEFPVDKDPQRVTKYIDHIGKLNYEGVTFPVNHTQYGMIEELNNININVFGYEDGDRYPIYISEKLNEDILNLLLITKSDKRHYVLIKDFDRFMYNQTLHKEKKHFCMSAYNQGRTLGGVWGGVTPPPQQLRIG